MVFSGFNIPVNYTFNNINTELETNVPKCTMTNKKALFYFDLNSAFKFMINMKRIRNKNGYYQGPLQ